MANKKKYNPFKMVGSWIGGIVAVLMPTFVTIKLNVNQSVGYILGIFVSFVIGFLIGWGIQSLIRKYKR